MARRVSLRFTGDAAADRLLADDPLALLIGMLLDQQVPMEWAFRGPATLRERLGGLDAAAIAAMDPDELVAACVEKPAVHRYPAAMARRIQALCGVVVDEHGGDASRIWTGVDDPAAVLAALRRLPGYGEQKARILLAVLGKRLGVAPAGWEEVASPYGDANPRSIADVDSPEALARVREWKRARKEEEAAPGAQRAAEPRPARRGRAPRSAGGGRGVGA